MMECLSYNVDNVTLQIGSLSDGFKAVLKELWQGLNNPDISDAWVEPNERKYAFRGSSKWSVASAKEVVQGAWGLLDY